MAKNVSNTKIDNLFLFYLHDSNFENRCVNMLKMRNNPYLLSVRFDSFNWSLKTGYSLFPSYDRDFALVKFWGTFGISPEHKSTFCGPEIFTPNFGNFRNWYYGNKPLGLGTLG